MTDAAKLIALNNIEFSTAVAGGTPSTTPATITMHGDAIRVTNSTISTDSSGPAPAGHIALSANTLLVDQSAKVTSRTTGQGLGGNIALTAGESVTLSNGAMVSASSTGLGDAGNITVAAGNQFLSRNASLTTQASQASGGNITIEAREAIRLLNSELSTSVQGGPTTTGGDIFLDPVIVTLQNSQVTAEAVQGQGGNIRIIAGTFLADPSSVVSASSQFGVSGNVHVQSPVSSLSNTLTTLPTRPLQAQPLMQQRCAAQANGQVSSLVVAGRDALPTEPGGWLMSPLVFANGDAAPGAHAHTGDLLPSAEWSEVLKAEKSHQWRAVRGGHLQRTIECGS